MINWKNTDPRDELVDIKHANIIIVRKSKNASEQSCLAYCEMKHSWFVSTQWKDAPMIKETWPQDWYWTLYDSPFEAPYKIQCSNSMSPKEFKEFGDKVFSVIGDGIKIDQLIAKYADDCGHGSSNIKSALLSLKADGKVEILENGTVIKV